jgi:hypothetical protein
MGEAVNTSTNQPGQSLQTGTVPGKPGRMVTLIIGHYPIAEVVRHEADITYIIYQCPWQFIFLPLFGYWLHSVIDGHPWMCNKVCLLILPYSYMGNFCYSKFVNKN